LLNWVIDPVNSRILQFLVLDALNSQLQQTQSKKFYLGSPVRGQGTSGHFELDYSLSDMPRVQDGSIDLIMKGIIFKAGGENDCRLQDQERLGFTDSEQFQLAFSEGQVECLLNAISQTGIGLLDFDTEAFQAFYEDNTLQLTAGTLSDKLGLQILEDKLGREQDLRVQLRLS